MTNPTRLYFLDHIRWLMIVLEVLFHVAVTYSNLGDWYYREPVELDPLSFLFFGIFLSFTQAYFMGLLFLIAGYFVTDSFDHKGPARFLRDRAICLGIPTFIYMLIINPAIEYYQLVFQWPEPRQPIRKAILKSNCARPPHPKGMGYASGRAPRLAGFQKHPNLRFHGSAHQNNCVVAFGCLIPLFIPLKKT